MKRAVFLYSLLFICLATSHAAFGQSAAKSNARKACFFNINGTWKSDATTQTTPIFFNFLPDGHVMLLAHTEETLPQDFEIITSVDYKLDKPAAPKRIEFTTWRGNDLFQQGITSLKIIEYSDNSFTTLNTFGQKSRWERLQTHMYFLTFAVRRGPLPTGDHTFVMWTLMDGRKTENEALGVRLIKDDAGKTAPVFGPISEEIYNQLTEESDKDKKSNKDENVFMRLELSEGEFETTHNLYLAWDKQVKNRALPNSDPYLNVLEFMKKVAESLNQCDEKVKLLSLSERERDEFVSKNSLPQFLLEYVKAMRKKNDEIHVSNRMFPWNWRPMIQAPGQ